MLLWQQQIDAGAKVQRARRKHLRVWKSVTAPLAMSSVVELLSQIAEPSTAFFCPLVPVAVPRSGVPVATYSYVMKPAWYSLKP